MRTSTQKHAVEMDGHSGRTVEVREHARVFDLPNNL